jgi:hypothetical protein
VGRPGIEIPVWERASLRDAERRRTAEKRREVGLVPVGNIASGVH